MPTTTGVATEFITFTRASNATVTDSDGKVKWAPHNLLLASEAFDASIWSTTSANVTVTANNVVAPNSTTTADTLAVTGTSYQYQRYSYGSAITGITMTFGVWLWTATGKATILMRLVGQATSTDQATKLVTLTSTPTYHTITRTFTSTDTLIDVGLDNRTIVGGDGISGNVIAWGAHLYRSDLGGMQPNTSAYPMYNPTTPKNLLGYTENFSTGWGGSNRTISADATIAPNGLQTADAIVETATTAEFSVSQSGNLIASTPYVVTVYAKARERSKLIIRSNAVASDFRNCGFDLLAGTVTRTASGYTATITSVGNGWYRCSAAFTSTSTAAATFGFCLTNVDPTSDAGPSYSGTLGFGLYLWGAQLSDSASLDPYAPNHFAAPSAAAYYGPRRDFNGATLACKGLLVEEQRANAITHSNTFSNAAWDKATGVLMNYTATTSPDGTSNGSLLTEDSGTSQHQINNFFAVTSGLTYTVSVFAKAYATGAQRWLNIYPQGGGSGWALFDLVAGTMTASGGANLVSAPPPVSVGNGWYRCSVTVTPTTTTNMYMTIYLSNSSTTPAPSYAGNGTSGLYLYGAQAELGSFATSYIPTGAATATRNADVASVSTQAFPYSATEGTLVVSGTLFGLNKNGSDGLVSLSSDFGAAENISIFRTATGNSIVASIRDNGSDQASYIVAMGSQPVKAAVAYAANNSNAALNGVAQTTDVTCSVPTMDKMLIGGVYYPGDYPTNGHIRQITYLPRRISNTELQTRTA